jgi:hypothetical protein
MTKPTEEFYDDGEEVIAEVRAARQRISARFGHDPYKLVAYLMERQRKHGDRIIPAPDPERTDRSAA